MTWEPPTGHPTERPLDHRTAHGTLSFPCGPFSKFRRRFYWWPLGRHGKWLQERGGSFE